MILDIHHSTVYTYSEPVKMSLQILKLTPVNQNRQRVLSWHVQTPVKPINDVDWFGNHIKILSVPDGLSKIEIIASGQVEVKPSQPNPKLGTIPSQYYLRQSNLTTPNGELTLLANSFNSNDLLSLDSKTILDRLNNMSKTILELVPYTRGVTNSETTAITALNTKGGVCQDHAHIFLSLARCLKLPARYVSGYLHTDDTSHLASHAWAEVWFDNAWHSFDISNQCQASEQHIELAYGLDYLDAAPVKGTRIGGGFEKMEVISLVKQI